MGKKVIRGTAVEDLLLLNLKVPIRDIRKYYIDYPLRETNNPLYLDEVYNFASFFWLAVIRGLGYKPIDDMAALKKFMDSEDFENIWKEYSKRRMLYSDANIEKDKKVLVDFKEKLSQIVHGEENFYKKIRYSPSISVNNCTQTIHKVFKEVFFRDVKEYYEKHPNTLSTEEEAALFHFSYSDAYIEAVANVMLTTEITVEKLVRFHALAQEYNLEWAAAMFDWRKS